MAGQRRAPNTEIAKRTPMQQMLAEVASDTFVARISNALPEDITPQRFVSVVATAIRRTPELITAGQESLFNAVLRCAQDGLMPDGREAALVIFKENGKPKVQYMPMIAGLRKVVADDGFTLNAHVVYEHDAFDYELGAKARITHKPPKLGEDRGKPLGAYATASDEFGRLVADPEVMSVGEIEHVRSKSKQKDGIAWRNDWPEMARKTVARRLFKSLPRGRQVSERVDRVVRAIDEEFDHGANGKPMSEAEANAAAAASTVDVPIGDRQQLRDEPAPAQPSDAQLNRVAALQEQVDERMWRATLRGMFGVDDVAQLSPEDASRYEQTLAAYTESGEEIEEATLLDKDGNEITL